MQDSYTERNGGGITFTNTHLALWALMPVTAWAFTVAVLGQSYGYHSTPVIRSALFGLPGFPVGGLLGYWTGSDSLEYVGIFLGNWVFWFGLLKAAQVLKHKLAQHG